MKTVNALQLRQSLGKVITSLTRNGQPILVEKGRKPVAVLISLKDFQERFVEKEALREREEILADIDALAMRSVDETPAVKILREIRGDG